MRLKLTMPIVPKTVHGTGAYNSTGRVQVYTVERIVAEIDATGQVYVSYRGKTESGRAMSSAIHSSSSALLEDRAEAEARLRRAWRAATQ